MSTVVTVSSLEDRPDAGVSKPRHWQRALVDVVNSMMRPLELSLVKTSSQAWWKTDSVPSVRIGGHDYRYFCHAYNCGWPTARMTERAVELAVADRWLTAIGSDVVEIGAVSPYYWPGRIRRVVDPFDEHALVTNRSSLFDMNLSGCTVLSISTLEHIGFADFGSDASDPTGPLRALQKLVAECDRFLVTVPYGYNPAADAAYFSDTTWAPDVSVRYLARTSLSNDWREVNGPAEARQSYRSPRSNSPYTWANGLAIIEKGRVL